MSDKNILVELHQAGFKQNNKLDDLINKLRVFSNERDWDQFHSPKNLIMALTSEVGELSDNVCKQKDIADDIGDIMVVLINIAKRNGLSIRHCLEVAYHDIKDRKGKMVDGIFVKEE